MRNTATDPILLLSTSINNVQKLLTRSKSMHKKRLGFSNENKGKRVEYRQFLKRGLKYLEGSLTGWSMGGAGDISSLGKVASRSTFNQLVSVFAVLGFFDQFVSSFRSDSCILKSKVHQVQIVSDLDAISICLKEGLSIMDKILSQLLNNFLGNKKSNSAGVNKLNQVNNCSLVNSYLHQYVMGMRQMFQGHQKEEALSNAGYCQRCNEDLYAEIMQRITGIEKLIVTLKTKGDYQSVARSAKKYLPDHMQALLSSVLKHAGTMSSAHSQTGFCAINKKPRQAFGKLQADSNKINSTASHAM